MKLNVILECDGSKDPPPCGETRGLAVAAEFADGKFEDLQIALMGATSTFSIEVDAFPFPPERAAVWSRLLSEQGMREVSVTVA